MDKLGEEFSLRFDQFQNNLILRFLKIQFKLVCLSVTLKILISNFK